MNDTMDQLRLQDWLYCNRFTVYSFHSEERQEIGATNGLTNRKSSSRSSRRGRTLKEGKSETKRDETLKLVISGELITRGDRQGIDRTGQDRVGCRGASSHHTTRCAPLCSSYCSTSPSTSCSPSLYTILFIERTIAGCSDVPDGDVLPWHTKCPTYSNNSHLINWGTLHPSSPSSTSGWHY